MAHASGSRSTRCCSPASARRSPRSHTGPKPSPARGAGAHPLRPVRRGRRAGHRRVGRLRPPLRGSRARRARARRDLGPRRARARRPSRSTRPTSPATFGSVIRDRLAKLGAHGERWASWKDEERGWIVKLEFTADTIDHDARWGFEPRKQSLHPMNSEATTLSQQGELKGGLIPRLRAVVPRVRRVALRQRRVHLRRDRSRRLRHGAAPRAAALRAHDAGHVEPGRRACRDQARRRADADARRDRRPARGPPPSPWRTRGRGRRARAAAAAAPAGPGAGRRDPAAGARAEADRGEARHGGSRPLGRQVDHRTRRARLAARRRVAPSMPSWDEIVFGARTDDDLA